MPLSKLSIGLLAWLCIFQATATVRADMILNTLGNIEWNPILQPGGPGPISISVSSNGNAPNDNVMNAFSVGLRLVAEPGSTGALTIASVAQPSANRVFANYAAPLSLVLQDSVFSVSGDNAVFANVSVPASGLRLFDMLLAPQDANVSGSFLIVADGLKSNYFTTTEFDGFKYGNIGNADFVLGRLNISTVPEPCTSLLLSLACAGIYWRRKR